MDADSPASRTALAVARYRAVHQVTEGGKVLHDPLAAPILGERLDLTNPDVGRRMRLFVCARSRYAEEVLAAAVPHGLDQLVVLGAGLDTFAYRNPYPRLRVVEVDHPATQAWKRQRLDDAGIEVPSSVTHVAVDFEGDDLGTVLAEALDLTRPVLFWWLGVTPYLTLQAIAANLTTLAAQPHTAVVLDHAAPDPHASALSRAREAQRAARVAEIGEPWVTAITPDDLTALGLRCGFEHVHHEDEAALLRRALGRRHVREQRVTHLALLTRGWWVGEVDQPRW